MYLKKIVIENIKSFSHLEIDFTDGNSGIRRWTTIFGKNGLGKSTLLQAIGATLAGPSAIRELIPVAENWVRNDESYGILTAKLLWTEGDSFPPVNIMGRAKTISPYIAKYIVTGDDPDALPQPIRDTYYPTVPTIVPWSGEGSSKQKGDLTKDAKRLQFTAYAEGKDGWLACGYGPFRRLSGGGQEADRILYAGRTSARFITLFREDAALTNTTEWLIRLHNTGRDGDAGSQRALKYVQAAFREKLFPDTTELIVDARSVKLRIGEEPPVSLQDLSDGYRSMLALSIDLIRWLTDAFPNSDDPMNAHGVVLIDELDAHLHPAWQRQIGYWLQEKFRNLQFIVATHSPFLAQVIDLDESGLLMSQDEIEQSSGNVILENTHNGVVARMAGQISSELRVDQILMSPLFDLDSLYSPPTEKRLERREELFTKKIRKGALNESENQEFEQLGMWHDQLETATLPADRKRERQLGRYVKEHSKELQSLE